MNVEQNVKKALEGISACDNLQDQIVECEKTILIAQGFEHLLFNNANIKDVKRRNR